MIYVIKEVLDYSSFLLSIYGVNLNNLEEVVDGNAYNGDIDLSFFKHKVYDLGFFRGEDINIVEVRGNFIITNSGISSLMGCPMRVLGDFVCVNNKNLQSLMGAPIAVGGDFNIFGCNLSDLGGFPREIVGDIIYGGNRFDEVQLLDFLKKNKIMYKGKLYYSGKNIDNINARFSKYFLR